METDLLGRDVIALRRWRRRGVGKRGRKRDGASGIEDDFVGLVRRHWRVKGGVDVGEFQ